MQRVESADKDVEAEGGTLSKGRKRIAYVIAESQHTKAPRPTRVVTVAESKIDYSKQARETLDSGQRNPRRVIAQNDALTREHRERLAREAARAQAGMAPDLRPQPSGPPVTYGPDGDDASARRGEKRRGDGGPDDDEEPKIQRLASLEDVMEIRLLEADEGDLMSVLDYNMQIDHMRGHPRISHRTEQPKTALCPELSASGNTLAAVYGPTRF